MSNASQSAKQEAISKLREWIKPGDTIYTILRHVSRSGMQRSISVLMLCDENTAAGDVPRVQAAPTDISMWVARALVDRIDQQRGGIKVSGCGMDMGFSIVYALSRTLYPEGFGCVGERCRSNDHSNGDWDYTPHSECDCMDCAVCYGSRVICGLCRMCTRCHQHASGCSGCPYTPHSPHRHWHTDGGYALQQRWL